MPIGAISLDEQQHNIELAKQSKTHDPIQEENSSQVSPKVCSSSKRRSRLDRVNVADLRSSMEGWSQINKIASEVDHIHEVNHGFTATKSMPPMSGSVKGLGGSQESDSTR